MKLITAIVRPNKFEDLKTALQELGVHGMTTTEVRGHGRQKGHKEMFRGREYVVDLLPKVRVEIAVQDNMVESIVEVILKNARSGEVGDGKIFIQSLEDCIRIRTSERGESAL